MKKLAAIKLTGDPVYARDFARYLAAELACNLWSQQVRIDCVGVAGEVAAMSPDRIHDHPVAALDDVVSTVAAEAASTLAPRRRRRPRRGHRSRPPGRRRRLARPDAAARSGGNAAGALDRLLRFTAQHPGRTGTAVVVHGNAGPDQPGLVLELSGDGRLCAPSLGLDLEAVGLTADEAAGCAALLAQADHSSPTGMPCQDDADGWRRFADEAGALRSEHTEPRAALATQPQTADSERRDITHAGPAREEDRAGDRSGGSSLLPEPDQVYEQAAATTAEDLAILAPVVRPETRTAVEKADPTLDADLDAWFSDTCALPRLTLLGPVGVRAHGAAIAKRRPYYAELVAFLATRPHGATPEEVARAFNINPARVRNDVKIARDWLGTNPLTGRLHLPDARESEAARARGIGVYQIEGLLIDADLFRRLRVRGQTRGPEGIADLQRALTLVTGPPLDQLRAGGWTWMYDGDRLDQHLLCAVVDVAHTVTTECLQAGDLAAARAAVETALLAAPLEEITKLDLAAVVDAEGHRHEAQTHRRPRNLQPQRRWTAADRAAAQKPGDSVKPPRVAGPAGGQLRIPPAHADDSKW